MTNPGCITEENDDWWTYCNDDTDVEGMLAYREVKFKRALRVNFLTHFTKNFCYFLTTKVKSDTDMIKPSIESSDFLFWHEKNFKLDF